MCEGVPTPVSLRPSRCYYSIGMPSLQGVPTTLSGADMRLWFSDTWFTLLALQAADLATG